MKNTTRKKRDSKLCVVFDIDETILEYLNTAERSRKFANKDAFDYAEIELSNGSTRYVVFRPGFIDFIKYAKRHRFSIAIWTYGDRQYADFIERVICEHYGFKKSPFLFVYSSAEIKEDVDKGLYEKDLRRIFEAFPGRFTSSNTFLVDNKPSNIYHETNMHNGFIVESFLADADSLRDRLFDLLQKICDKIIKKNRASNTPIFGKENVQSMDLEQYYRQYVKDDKTISVLSTDRLDFDQNFTLNKVVMDEDAMMMVGVSLFLESYCDDLFDLMELVESDIEDHVIRIKEYTRIIGLLETATDVEAIRRRILDVEFDLRYSMVFYNVICERIVFTTK